MPNRIHFHDVPHSKKIKDEFETLAGSLRDDFPWILKIEVSLSHAQEEIESHVHITAKDFELAASATGREMSECLADAVDKARKQLRKHHDKVVFSHRRDAQRSSRS